MTGLSEAIGFGLAVAGSIDLAPKYGQQLSKRISELKRSTELTRHLRAFEIEPERRLLASRLERGRAICNDPHADPAIKEELDRTFVEMGNLVYQIGKVSSRSGYFAVETWPYTARNRAHLEGDIKYLAQLLIFPGVWSTKRRCRACWENLRCRLTFALMYATSLPRRCSTSIS